MNLAKTRSTSGILEPGLWQLKKGTERYRVPACGMIVVELYSDDVLTVKTPEGAQIAEIIPFTEKGNGDPALLGIKKTLPAKGLQEILARDSESAIKVRKSIEKRDFKILELCISRSLNVLLISLIGIMPILPPTIFLLLII